MNIVLLGAPGAGKGTQAFKIAEEYQIPHISTGDIFRANIKGGTPLGVEAKNYIDKGQLVPDELTCKIVEDRINQDDCKNGFMLDGFPRNLFQAEELSKMTKIDTVINISVPLENLMARLTGRRVCKDCGDSYHVNFIGDTKTCSRCGGELYQRADDNEQSVKTRLDVYSSKTKPLIEYYEAKNVLKNVNGDQNIDNVFAEIKKILG